MFGQFSFVSSLKWDVVVFLEKKILYVVTNQQVHVIAVSLLFKLEGKVKPRTQSTVPLLGELLLVQFQAHQWRLCL